MDIKTTYLTAGHPNRPGTVLKKVTGIVVHWTGNESAGADAVGNRNYFNRTWKGTQKKALESDGSPFRYASAHLNVDDHQLVEVLPWKKGVAEMGYHVGGTYVDGICNKLGTSYPNDSTIGLEICVNADGNFSKTYWNAVGVIAWMLSEHGLGIDALIRHYDVTHKQCPMFFVEDSYAVKYFGNNFDAESAYATFRKDVQDELDNINEQKNPPAYFKVFQNGQLYKYQFTTYQGGVDCADMLFVQSNGTDGSIYVQSPAGDVVYNPASVPEKFPQFHKTEAQKAIEAMSDELQQQVYAELKKKFG